MPASTTVTGMVLSAMPVGDYDKRLVILTKEIGKISAFAKGARRPNSALLACSQPFTFGNFILYAGRNSYNIMSCEMSNYFPELREQIDSVYYGLYFCEFADYITKENNDEKDILKLLYQTLRAVAKKTIDIRLVRAVYELKLMVLNGEAPQVFTCVKCGKEPHRQVSEEQIMEETGLAEQKQEKGYGTIRYRFSADAGGILCEMCRYQDKNAALLSTSTLYAMQYIVSSSIEKLYTFTVSDEVLEELILNTGRYLEHYIDHEFKALELIRTIF